MSDKKYALFPLGNTVFYGTIQRETKTKYFVKLGFKPDTEQNERPILKKDTIKLFNNVEECWLTYCKLETMYKTIQQIEADIKNTIEDLKNED